MNNYNTKNATITDITLLKFGSRLIKFGGRTTFHSDGQVFNVVRPGDGQLFSMSLQHCINHNLHDLFSFSDTPLFPDVSTEVNFLPIDASGLFHVWILLCLIMLCCVVVCYDSLCFVLLCCGMLFILCCIMCLFCSLQLCLMYLGQLRMKTSSR